MSIQLNGITWSHSRGYTSITAVSQRFCELHPDVSIHWENVLYRNLPTHLLKIWQSLTTCL